MEIKTLEIENNYIKLKQSRVYVLAILELPEKVRETTPQAIVKNCEGSFLLGFNTLPYKGLYFPYEGQIWLLHHNPIQIPSRYYSREKKHSPIIKPMWICSYNNLEDSLNKLVYLNQK